MDTERSAFDKLTVFRRDTVERNLPGCERHTGGRVSLELRVQDVELSTV